MFKSDNSTPQSVSGNSIYLFNLIYKQVPDKRPERVYLKNETVERIPVNNKVM